MSQPWVVLDIEGTTTPISFVYDVLFPYARQRLLSGLESLETAERERIASLLLGEWQTRTGQSLPDPNSPGWLQQAAQAAQFLMDQDLKFGPLKELQGRIWRDGYQEGHLQGQVFSDVAAAFSRWHNQGIKIAIYSSGSVEAQQLLFTHARGQDLGRFISHYFDTGVGPKTDFQSYLEISRRLEPSGEPLFLTDVVAEAKAARQAGWQAAIMVRPGNRPCGPHDFEVFEELLQIPQWFELTASSH